MVIYIVQAYGIPQSIKYPFGVYHISNFYNIHKFVKFLLRLRFIVDGISRCYRDIFFTHIVHFLFRFCSVLQMAYYRLLLVSIMCVFGRAVCENFCLAYQLFVIVLDIDEVLLTIIKF